MLTYEEAAAVMPAWGPGEPPSIEYTTRSGKTKRSYLPAYECLNCNHAVAQAQLDACLRAARERQGKDSGQATNGTTVGRILGQTRRRNGYHGSK